MDVKYASEKELLQEISRRMDDGKIKWKNVYFFDVDKTETKISCEGYTLILRQKTEINRSYFCRQVYKTFETTLKKIELDRMSNKQNAEASKLLERLNKEIKK